jgi:hypothetical protein
MVFSVRKLLSEPVSRTPLELLPAVSATPLYDSRVADEFIGTTLIRIEADSSRTFCLWKSIPWVRVGRLPPAERAGCKRLLKPHRQAAALHPLACGTRLADLWFLLSYLVEAGPLRAPICALEPFHYQGRAYIAQWAEIPDGAPGCRYGISLIRDRTPFPANVASVMESQLLLSHPAAE